MLNRSLLLGFGAGLVFSAGFLLLSPLGTSAPVKLSVQEVTEAATAQNLVVIPKEEYQRLTKAHAGAKQQAGEHVPPKQPVPPPKPEAAALPAQAKAPVAAAPVKPASPSPPQRAIEAVSFRVEVNDTAAAVSQNLVRAGLLPSSNRLVELLRSKNKLNRIRTGSYQIPQGASEEEIFAILTTPPKR